MMSPAHKKGQKTTNLWHRISLALADGIANRFYRLGYLIATHPWNTIIVCLLLACTFCVGFIKFKIEKNPLELWIPKDSTFLTNTNWILEHMQYAYRLETVLITAPNVLDPRVLRKAAQIRNEVIQITAPANNGSILSYDDVCLKVPFVANVTSSSRRRRRRRDIDFSEDEFGGLFDETESTKAPTRVFNPSVDVKPAIYCKFINKLPYGCFEQNIIEMWKYDENEFHSMTRDDVIHKLNSTTVGPVTGHDTDFTETLGGIIRNETGHIVSAKALIMRFYLKLNFSEVDVDATGNMAGTEEWVTEAALLWEDEYLKKLQELKSQFEDNETEIMYASGRSFGDISSRTMFQEIDKILIGGLVVSLYVQLVISKYSWTEFRIMLGSVGLLIILLAYACSCGICAAIGIFYGPVHASLPFLLLGLGVDDMFVLMACWRQVCNEKGSIEERIALMLKHAGAAITVTSLTDIVAFTVGSTTVLPSLRSFCLYAAVGIILTYFFVLTLFVAVFTLDEYRIEAKRNSFLPCIVHKDEVVKVWFDTTFLGDAFRKLYSEVILTKAGKAIIILTVIIFTSISIESLLKLEQKFDPAWFIPKGTYLHKFIDDMKINFPDSGFEAQIFIGQINYTESLPRIKQLVTNIDDNDDIFYKVDSWIKPFSEFVQIYYHKNISSDYLTDYEWRYFLSKFLYSKNGGKYQALFRFDGDLKCGEPTPNVTVSGMEFRFRRFPGRDVYVPAMHKIHDMVAEQNFTSGEGVSVVWAKIFANWITDEIIDREVLRNIGLAMACVMLCTVLVIINLQICFWILLCVVLTLINVTGFMQRWGLTIDIVSCIALQLAVGLCVDYATHIGHTFLVYTTKGDRNQRALDTVSHIGMAVINGGGSTLLAITMLANSDAYVFQLFFKIFLLVIVFGLFHGIVFLPVVLSIIGPDPLRPEEDIDMKSNGYHCDKDQGEEMQTINNKHDNNMMVENSDCEENERLNS